MTKSEIIPAKRWHCGKMTRILRDEHKDTMVALSLNAHTEMWMAFDRSCEVFAWLIDGRLAGLGGVVGTLSAPIGQVWLALSQEATKHPVMVVREALRQIKTFLCSHTELQATFLKGDATALQFAYCLGFENVTTEMMSEMGVILMRIRRET